MATAADTPPVTPRLRWPRTAAGRVEDWLLAERAQVPLWSPAAFGLGIVLYFMLPWAAERTAAVVVAFAVAGLGLVVRGMAGRMLVWAGVLVVLGFGIAAYRSNDVESPVLRDRYQGDVAGIVEAIEVRTGRNQVRFLLAPDDPGLPRHVRLSLKPSAVPPGLAPGAQVRLRAMLLPPQGPSFPGGYDFARTLWFAQIGATGYPLGTAVVTRAAPPPAGVAAWLDDARTRLTRRIERAVPGDAGAISAAFVTGDQGQISQEVNLAMRWSGMAHLLSISGVHIAIVVGGTMWLTRALLCLSPWIALRWPVKAISAGAAAMTGIAYTILAGAQVPTVRSCIGTVVVLFGVILGREALSLRLLAAGGFVILAVRPEALLGPSFQLTFAAVTGLVALFNSKFGRWLMSPRQHASRVSRTLQHLAGLFVTGIIAEALLSATALFHFNSTGAYGVLANLIAIPWTEFVIMPLLVVALALDPLGVAHGTGIAAPAGDAVEGSRRSPGVRPGVCRRGRRRQRPPAPRLVPPALAQARSDRTWDNRSGGHLALPPPGRDCCRVDRGSPVAAAAAGLATARSATSADSRSNHPDQRACLLGSLGPKGRLAVAAQQPGQLALDPHPRRQVALRRVHRVRRFELDHALGMLEILERGVAAVDEGDDDVAVAGAVAATDQGIVAVEDAGIDHRVARHLECIMVAGAEQRRGHREQAIILERGDRLAGRDAAVEGQFDDVVRRRRRAAAEIGVNDFTLRRGRGSLRHLPLNDFGHPQDLERPRAVGQAANEGTFLERIDQAMDARLGLEGKRILHLLERWRDAAFVKAHVDEGEQIVLLARQHRTLQGTYGERLGNTRYGVKSDTGHQCSREQLGRVWLADDEDIAAGQDVEHRAVLPGERLGGAAGQARA